MMALIAIAILLSSQVNEPGQTKQPSQTQEPQDAQCATESPERPVVGRQTSNDGDDEINQSGRQVENIEGI